MITVKAIEKVYKNGKQIGWKIMDEQGNTKDATTESIKMAIINNQATVINLVLTPSGKLEMINQPVNANKGKRNNVKPPSYFGIQIKNLKKFVGREGEAYQGDVWLNGNKLGFWSQDANGCISDRFEFDEYLLLESLHKHQARTGRQYENTECLMNAVISHIEDYKQYNKILKKGAKSMIMVTDYYGMYVTYIGTMLTNAREIESKHYCDIEKYMNKYNSTDGPAKYMIYTSIDDFIIE